MTHCKYSAVNLLHDFENMLFSLRTKNRTVCGIFLLRILIDLTEVHIISFTSALSYVI